jgi:AcrR family transcriptional regulator
MRRADRNRQLVEVAEQVFAERGIAAASMEEIADRAGITKPILYDHFGSKDGLLAAVIERAGSDLGTSVETAVAGADGPEDAFARGLTAYFSFMDTHRASWLALLTETTTNSAAAHALEGIREERARFIAELIVAEVPGSDAARAMTYSQVVIGACERLATAPQRASSASPETLAANLMDVIWMGFRAIRSGERWRDR